MQIAIIVGSHRKDSQSAKVARFLASQLTGLGDHSCWICDLGKDPLPLWDEEIGSDAPQWSGLTALTEKIDAADAFIMIAPEWHGMVPAALKNFFWSAAVHPSPINQRFLWVCQSALAEPIPSMSFERAAIRTIASVTCQSI